MKTIAGSRPAEAGGGLRRLVVLCVTATLVVGTAGCAGGDGEDGVLELKLGHVGAPGSLFDVAANEFARRVNETLEGRVHLTVFGSSQLGDDETLLQKLRLGTVDFSIPSTIMSSRIDQFGLFELPYLVRDRAHMREIEEAVVWPELAPLAERQGYEILAVWENGFRHITNSVRPIVGPEDLEGIKLRTPRGVWRVKLFKTLGANPSPMAYSELFMALQTGVVDGQENPLAQIYSARLHEVQDYLSLTGHVYTPSYVTVGAARWAELPEEIRPELRRIAREVQPFVYEQAAELDARLLERMRESGIAVNEADPERFLAAARPLYEEFASTVEGGRELLDRVRSLDAP